MYTLNNLLSIIGTCLSLTTVWLLGSKRYKQAFIVSMCSDPIWGYLGVTTGLFGMTLLAITTFLLNARGLYNLKKNTQCQ